MFLIEFFTDEDDTVEVIFSAYPTDQEIQDYISEHDWLGIEFATTGLEWAITPVEFVDNIKTIPQEENN